MPTPLDGVPIRTDRIKLGISDIDQLPLGEQMKTDIKTVLGTRYTRGGETTKDGFDCSGLVWWMCLCSLDQRDVACNRPSATDLSNRARRTLSSSLPNQFPCVLAIDKVTADNPNSMAHALIVCGTVERDNQTYYIVVQAGKARGIGNDDSTVSAYLVSESKFRRAYSDFGVYYAKRPETLQKEKMG